MKLSAWYQKRNIKDSVAEKPKQPDDTLPKTEDILKSIIELNKAMDIKDWKKIYTNHEPSQSKIVDPTYHIANSKPHPAYTELVKGKKNIHVSSPRLDGIAPKVVHKLSKDTFMTKPYMGPKPFGHVGLSGWGIMTTSNLYNASGLGDIIENVHAQTIKDKPYIGEVPVTVHNFAKGYTEVDNAVSRTNINPTHSRQIGLMDYLTGNFDRHSGNLMVGDTVDDSGYRPLMAIDHDHSFHYEETRERGAESPKDSYEWSAMRRHLQDGMYGKEPKHDKHISNWWKDSKHDIYNEMNRNLQAVTDDNLRKYIRKNFDERYKKVSDWADSYDKTGQGFLKQTDKPILHKLHEVSDTHVNEVLKKLPTNKTSGMEILTDLFKEHTTPKQQAIMKQAITKLAKLMTPSELLKFYARSDDDVGIKSTKKDILMDMKSNPEMYSQHLTEILKFNKSLPKASRFLNLFWEKHIEDSLNNKQKDSLKEAQ